MGHFSWSDDRVELLRKLHAEGYSASLIAARIAPHGEVSRSAVIGKIHRLGLQRGGKSGHIRKPVATAPWRARAARKALPKAERAERKVRATRLESLPVPPNDVVPDTAIQIADLEPHHCRWIHGDSRGAHGYCGKPKVPGLSYCQGHAAIAYAAPTTRKEKDEAREKYKREHARRLREKEMA